MEVLGTVPGTQPAGDTSSCLTEAEAGADLILALPCPFPTCTAHGESLSQRDLYFGHERKLLESEAVSFSLGFGRGRRVEN